MKPFKFAVFYQAIPSPIINNIVNPVKPGWYSDSGADIAFNLRNEVEIITPSINPNEENTFDWVFPDSEAGFNKALDMGANTLWLNTVLFSSHHINKFKNKNLFVVGQIPELVEKYDDKWFTNCLLRKSLTNVVKGFFLENTDILKLPLLTATYTYPLIVKPVKGCGSEGVALVKTYPS